MTTYDSLNRPKLLDLETKKHLHGIRHMGSPLILLSSSGEAFWACDRSGKDRLIMHFDEAHGDRLLFA